MKYFIISCEKEKNNIPILKNWYDEIKLKDINMENHTLIDDRKLFMIEHFKNLVFTDVISGPYFLVSELFRKVLDMYNIKMIYKEIVLLEPKYRYVKIYYLPILREVKCISENTQFMKYSNNISKLVLKRSKIGKRDIIFKVVINNKVYTIVRMDLIESILMREAKGIKLEEVEMEE